MNFKEHKRDIIAISSLLIIVTAITLLLLNIDLKVGVYYVRDVFFYLNNALFYAGYDTGLADTRGLSPLIPMITSVFFRMGFISDSTIIIVSSVFYIFSALGMYFLLRLRFDEILSFTGSMILSTFPLIIVWITKGMLDIPGLCFSIWSVYFMMLAFRKNTKFFYIAFPLIILGFFTRFTVFLMVPVLLIQFFLEDEPVQYIKDNIKDIICGISIGALVFAIFIGIYYFLDIGMFFLSQGQDISGSTQTVIDTSYNNIFYYINNFLIYLGTQKFIPYSLKPGSFHIADMKWHGGYPSIISYILLIILLFGLVLYLKKLFSNENKEILKNKNNKLKLAIFVIGLAVFLFTFIKISILLSLIIISISLLALYRILYKTDVDYFSFDFIMIFWFVVNFSFFTYHHIKVDRYFIPMLPVVVYYIILSMYLIFNKLKSHRYMEKIRVIAPIGLICLILLCSGVFALGNSPHTFDNQMHPNFATAASEEKAVGEWLIKHDPQYMNKTIWADRGGDMSFLLKKEIPSCEKTSNETNFTSEMVKNKVSYFIAKDNKTIGQPYTKLYQNGEVYLYYYENGE
ncbi:glycosyltransferase family 39 protein [Methanobrevibacter sp.]|uniref:glycosyltransferase family 39 protein n=1 Tax=Methanobrevibacter sp. TaxID=66852 RepID=UPI0026E081F0|nr:glycosyltransferase family 39 protein [Methanobrevibacter sp.]MDO5859720.1 glycosyltransferase family 39 protein [Methanobrevibacter sp.]